MELLKQFKQIRAFIFDVDGVLTDGGFQLLHDGTMSRKVSVKDGYALQLAIKKGYRVAFISAGRSGIVVKRLNDLGVEDVYMESKDKKQTFIEYSSRHRIAPEQTLFLGDDIPDMALMEYVGLPTCPKNAVPEIKMICRYISPFEGGQGSIRDVIERVLKLNDDWVG